MNRSLGFPTGDFKKLRLGSDAWMYGDKALDACMRTGLFVLIVVLVFSSVVLMVELAATYTLAVANGGNGGWDS
eukprot:1391893-Amorphochlora_amoeboformis.AAC.3